MLSKIPEEFHVGVAHFACETGHASGYHEVIYYLTELVNYLEEPIENYTERLKKENK